MYCVQAAAVAAAAASVARVARVARGSMVVEGREGMTAADEYPAVANINKLWRYVGVIMVLWKVENGRERQRGVCW